MTTGNGAVGSPGRRGMFGVIAAAAVAAMGLGAQAAQAAPVDLSVIDRDAGQALQVWRKGGLDFVAGRPGAPYSLRVTNNTGKRVLVVLSVDGVNVLTGQTAAYGQRGYIFDPYQSYEISGWRKSDNTVAAFNFTALSSSYAALTGRPNNVGVIGMAVFDEKYRPPPIVYAPPAISNQAEASRAAPGRGGSPPPPPVAAPVAPQARDAAAAGSVSSQRPSRESLGTGHGAIEWSPSTVESFERATTYPQFTWQVQYDTYANLVARGVIPRARPPARLPQPFPGAGYVPDPSRR